MFVVKKSRSVTIFLFRRSFIFFVSFFYIELQDTDIYPEVQTRDFTEAFLVAENSVMPDSNIANTEGLYFTMGAFVVYF